MLCHDGCHRSHCANINTLGEEGPNLEVQTDILSDGVGIRFRR